MRNPLLMILASLILGVSLLTLIPQPTPSQAETTPRETLTEYAARAVAASSHKLSAPRAQLTSLMLADIAGRTFTDRAHQEYWITLIGVESGYNSAARSPTGAVGLGQLIPSYKADFGKDCGWTEVAREDLDDAYVNASLSACYFRTVLAANGGSVPLALISYNAGMYSKDLKAAKNGSAPGVEPSAHATRTWVKHTAQANKETP